jgi:DNA-binding winged helix-turn-helix (wHTH) protein
MEFEVKKTFRDKLTEKIYEKGSFYQNEDENRIKTLKKGGFIFEKENEEPKMEKTVQNVEKQSKKTRTKKQTEKGLD